MEREQGEKVDKLCPKCLSLNCTGSTRACARTKWKCSISAFALTPRHLEGFSSSSLDDSMIRVLMSSHYLESSWAVTGPYFYTCINASINQSGNFTNLPTFLTVPDRYNSSRRVYPFSTNGLPTNTSLTSSLFYRSHSQYVCIKMNSRSQLS